jgi:PncC family amidohydrolase
MQDLLPTAQHVAQRLMARGETIAIAESSAGGLISAALLSVGGASAYFVGGAVVYTRSARSALLDIGEAALEGMRPSTEAYALLLARTARARLGTTWALAETGAAGLAVAGPVEQAMTLETGSADRLANMRAFALAGLNLLLECAAG